MRRKVCYTFLRMVSCDLNGRKAMKEGFCVKSGNSLKAFVFPRKAFVSGDRRGLRKGLFSALFDCPERVDGGWVRQR